MNNVGSAIFLSLIAGIGVLALSVIIAPLVITSGFASQFEVLRDYDPTGLLDAIYEKEREYQNLQERHQNCTLYRIGRNGERINSCDEACSRAQRSGNQDWIDSACNNPNRP